MGSNPACAQLAPLLPCPYSPGISRLPAHGPARYHDPRPGTPARSTMTRLLISPLLLALATPAAVAGPPADKVNEAVAKGVTYLKGQAGAGGDHGVGRAALTGMALVAPGP